MSVKLSSNISFVVRGFASRNYLPQKIVFTLAFLLFAGFLAVKPLLAQNNDAGRLDLTVSPPVIELTAKPGDKVIEKFRVRNNLNSPIALQVDARRLISDPNSGTPQPETSAKGEELSWITFDRPEFTANPQEWQDVTFTIDIPKTAAYGYYYVFRIHPKEGSEIKSSGAAIQGEILVVALLDVLKSGAQSKTELVSFKPQSMVNEYLPVGFSVKLKNVGNVHSKPRGNIFITRGGGPQISILEVNPNNGSILPGGTREFTTSWDDGFIVKQPVVENGTPKLDKNGKPVTHLQINWNKLTDFRAGPYEARLLMVYDDGSKDATIEGSTTFWVIPYTAIAFILTVIIVIIIVSRFILKWYIGQAVKKSRR